MLMTVDVGNTNIAVGIYREGKLVTSFRMITKSQRTSDEFGSEFYSILTAKGMKLSEITDVVVSSVVPNLNHALVSSIKKYFHVDPMVISTKLDTGIITDIPDLGNDRLVDAAAAFHEYGGPVLVIDFGTATTYDYIDAEGKFITGITAPGVQIEADALTNMAAQLPKIELVKPASAIATDTITSMQVGIVYGYIGSVEYIINAVREEMNEPFKVIATGGLGSLICPHTKSIDVYDPNLAYKGMKLIWEKNHK